MLRLRNLKVAIVFSTSASLILACPGPARVLEELAGEEEARQRAEYPVPGGHLQGPPGPD